MLFVLIAILLKYELIRKKRVEYITSNRASNRTFRSNIKLSVLHLITHLILQ